MNSTAFSSFLSSPSSALKRFSKSLDIWCRQATRRDQENRSHCLTRHRGPAFLRSVWPSPLQPQSSLHQTHQRAMGCFYAAGENLNHAGDFFKSANQRVNSSGFCFAVQVSGKTFERANSIFCRSPSSCCSVAGSLLSPSPAILDIPCVMY